MKSFKIVVVGDTSVGKSSLIHRFINRNELSTPNSTIGASFSSVIVNINNENIRLNIWDTAGQERYRSLVTMYYRDADYCFIVFDISNINTENIDYWIEESRRNINKLTTKYILIGNKSDLKANSLMIDSIIESIKTKYNIDLIETSAHTGYNVDKLFLHISKILNENYEINSLRNSTSSSNDSLKQISYDYIDDYNSKKKCC